MKIVVETTVKFKTLIKEVKGVAVESSQRIVSKNNGLKWVYFKVESENFAAETIRLPLAFKPLILLHKLERERAVAKTQAKRNARQ